MRYRFSKWPVFFFFFEEKIKYRRILLILPHLFLPPISSPTQIFSSKKSRVLRDFRVSSFVKNFFTFPTSQCKFFFFLLLSSHHVVITSRFFFPTLIFFFFVPFLFPTTKNFSSSLHNLPQSFHSLPNPEILRSHHFSQTIVCCWKL